MNKTFGHFTAELIPNDDREGVNCFVSHANGATNSLALLLDSGGSFDDDGGKPWTIGVGPLTLNQIEQWALANGY